MQWCRKRGLMVWLASSIAIGAYCRPQLTGARIRLFAGSYSSAVRSHVTRFPSVRLWPSVLATCAQNSRRTWQQPRRLVKLSQSASPAYKQVAWGRVNASLARCAARFGHTVEPNSNDRQGPACLTHRSSGAPSAGHQAREAVMFIIGLAGPAPCRRRPLSSNVRRQEPY